MKTRNIPNILSALRILLVPVFVWLFFEYDNIYYCLTVFLAAGMTDIIDGYLARKNGWITNLGKVLDPFADKIMQCTVLICFTIKEFISVWLVSLFVIKELFMLVGAILAYRKIHFVVMSKWYGKLTTAIFYLTIFIIFVFNKQIDEYGAAELIVIPAFALTIFSMVMYIIDTLQVNAAQNKNVRS